MITLNSYSNVNESIQQLLPKLTALIEQTIEVKKCCALALAGGNTPKPLYKALSKERLAWEKISITLTDERWVAVDHEDSNENMIKHVLLNKLAAKPSFIPLKNDAITAQAGAIEAGKLLAEEMPQLDMVILGMGEDGHFASIFPGVSNLNALLSKETTSKCIAVSPMGKQGRISLTYSYLLSAKTIFLVISGEKKKAIIHAILDSTESHQDYPIYKLLNQTVCPVHIYWHA